MGTGKAKRPEIKTALKGIMDMDMQEEEACQSCQDLLYAYIDAELDGKDATSLFPQVKSHLDECEKCARAYDELRNLLLMDRQGKFVQPPVEPDFDFSYLQRTESPRPPKIPWRLDELGRLIIEFSAELVRALQPSAYATAGLKSDKSSKTLCRLSLKEAAKDLEVTITAEERRDDPALCTIIVEVDIPSRDGWPHLGDTEVTLRRGEAKLRTQRTDAYGTAVFQGVATEDLAHLVFEIAPRT